ncbi:MAG: type VI secretion system protein TssA [Desulfohalobiaceae bacterium]|nr:type VI secretion system protein TssA [Desulfohalobiaceae bacterium]
MEILELGRKPISEESPAGSDVTYEPDYEALQQEIDKLSIATAATGEVDWKKVQNLCSGILANQSKNILVAAYLAESLIKNEQFGGIGKGTQVLRDLVENFWDTLYPPKKRKKGRLNALRWWYERVEGFLKEHDPNPLPAAEVNSLKENLQALDELLSEKSDDAPLLRPLIQHVDRLPVQKAEEDEAEPPASEPEAEAPEQENQQEEPRPQKASPGPAPVQADRLESDKDANKLLGVCLDSLAKIANFYFEKDLSRPLPFVLNRLKTWMDVDQLPMVQEENRTPLPPPEPLIKSGLEGQLSSRDYESVVQSSESRLREFIFWLDLNRYCAQALEALGGKHVKAYEAVCRETAGFVQRLPGVEKLCFSDGTPLADSETRAWLKTLIAADNEEEGDTVQGDGFRQEVKDLEKEALALQKEKKKPQAVGLFQERLQRSVSKREALFFRIALCRFLLNMGKPGLAEPHLEELLAEIGQHELESWEPELAVRAMQVAYQGFQEKNEPEMEQRAKEVLNRISRINPVAAMRMAEQ